VHTYDEHLVLALKPSVTLGEAITDACVAKKMLRVFPKQFSQIAVPIEMLLDINSLTVEDLVSRLKPSEDRVTIDSVIEQAGWLILTEEEWLSKYRHRLNSESSSSSGGGDKSGSYNTGKQKVTVHGDKKDPVVKLISEGTPHRKGHCRNYGIYGHWKQYCKRPGKDHREEAHHVQVDADQPTLLLTTMNVMRIKNSWRDIALVETGVTHQVLHLNEDKVYPLDCDDDKDVWVLDTGASNHMTGCHEALASLDTSVWGTIRFRDGSLVEIEGIGSVMLQTKKVGHKVLTEVYFIPKLKSNIISIGQLEEGSCEIVIKRGFCSVYDVQRCLLACAPRVKNRLYLLKTQLAAPVCLVAKSNDEALLWHGRYGHLNFRALHDFGVKRW
jgi:hypothetical protein